MPQHTKFCISVFAFCIPVFSTVGALYSLAFADLSASAFAVIKIILGGTQTRFCRFSCSAHFAFATFYCPHGIRQRRRCADGGTFDVDLVLRALFLERRKRKKICFSFLTFALGCICNWGGAVSFWNGGNALG